MDPGVRTEVGLDHRRKRFEPDATVGLAATCEVGPRLPLHRPTSTCLTSRPQLYRGFAGRLARLGGGYPRILNLQRRGPCAGVGLMKWEPLRPGARGPTGWWLIR